MTEPENPCRHPDAYIYGTGDLGDQHDRCCWRCPDCGESGTAFSSIEMATAELQAQRARHH